MKVPFSFLIEQFRDSSIVFEKMKESLSRCDFTLGKDLLQFEKTYAEQTGCRHAMGVGSGTDALFLSLKAIGVGAGDEVITVPNSFIATTGAIVQAGARPVFVDIGEDFCLDPEKIAPAISEKTKAVLPVHWGGGPCRIEEICEVAARYRLPVLEDACQSLGAEWNGKRVGSFGLLAGFSTHPIKPLHVWGDGGVITTNSDEMVEKIRLLRNHGLKDRDTVESFGYNSRFDNLQAIVGNHVFESLNATIAKRREYAEKMDEALRALGEYIEVPLRYPQGKNVFHLYQFSTRYRDELLAFLIAAGVEAKVHYPIPLHLQPAARVFGYQEGDFPLTEKQSRESITLPCHQFLSLEQIDYMMAKVKEFFSSKMK